jgi:hypothetical protein
LLLDDGAISVLEDKCTPSNDIAPRGLEKDIVEFSTAIMKGDVLADVQVE